MRHDGVVLGRDRSSGVVIARCSQPEVGWLGWRNTKDENFLQAIAATCALSAVTMAMANGHAAANGEEEGVLEMIEKNTKNRAFLLVNSCEQAKYKMIHCQFTLIRGHQSLNTVH